MPSSQCDAEFFRSTEDASPDFLSIMANLMTNAKQLPISHGGCWSYPDMLELGSGKCRLDTAGPRRRPGGLDLNESRAHFGAWCIVSSPLILSVDLSDDAAYDAAWPIISNTDAIRVSQATAGDVGRLILQSAAAENLDNLTVYHGSHCEVVWLNQQLPRWTVWAKTLDKNGSEVAVLVINNRDGVLPAVSISVPLASVFGAEILGTETLEKLDIWTRVRAEHQGNLEVPELSPHSSYFLTLRRSSTSNMITPVSLKSP